MKNITPKEKAKHLVDKYKHIYLKQFKANTEYWDLFLITDGEAKMCALIAVDEIINNVLIGIDMPATWGNYWQEVKKEIELL
jgi:hypothetical protein